MGTAGADMTEVEKAFNQLLKQSELITQYKARDAEFRQRLAAAQAELQEERRKTVAAVDESRRVKEQLESLQTELNSIIKDREVQAAAAGAANQGKLSAEAAAAAAHESLQAAIQQQHSLVNELQVLRAYKLQVEDSLVQIFGKLGYRVLPAHNTSQQSWGPSMAAASQPSSGAAQNLPHEHTARSMWSAESPQHIGTAAQQHPQPPQLQQVGLVPQSLSAGGRDPRVGSLPSSSHRPVLQDQNSAPAPLSGPIIGRTVATLPTGRLHQPTHSHLQQQQQPFKQPLQPAAASVPAPPLMAQNAPSAVGKDGGSRELGRAVQSSGIKRQRFSKGDEAPLPKLICEKKVGGAGLQRSSSGGVSGATASSASLGQRFAGGGRYCDAVARRTEYPAALPEDPVVWLNKNIFSYVQALRKESHFHLFKDPVPQDTEGYYETIKRPMDLRTIAEKAEDQEYGTPDEFKGHLELVVQNAREFNPKGHFVHTRANQLWDWINKTNSFFSRVDDEWRERKKAFEGYTSG